MYEKVEVYAKRILDQLIKLDKGTLDAYYTMGQLIHAISEGALYQVLGYDNLSQLMDEELSYSSSTGHHYRKLYARFKALKYTKPEALKLMEKFGMTNLNRVLPAMNQKLGTRGIKRRVDALDIHQMNFLLTNKDYDKVRKLLLDYGAERTPEGRMLHASEALMEMVRSQTTDSRRREAA